MNAKIFIKTKTKQINLRRNRIGALLNRIDSTLLTNKRDRKWRTSVHGFFQCFTVDYSTCKFVQRVQKVTQIILPSLAVFRLHRACNEFYHTYFLDSPRIFFALTQRTLQLVYTSISSALRNSVTFVIYFVSDSHFYIIQLLYFPIRSTPATFFFFFI